MDSKRKVTRFASKHPEEFACLILQGNMSFSSQSFLFAIGNYLQAYHMKPNDTLVNLLIGTSFLNMIRQKSTVNRHDFVVKAFAFLFRYFHLSNDEQERNYNLGRAFHALGLYKFAIPYYEAVLCFKVRRHTLDGRVSRTDLKQESAFNLSKIYELSGNKALAKKVIFQNIVIQ